MEIVTKAELSERSKPSLQVPGSILVRGVHVGFFDDSDLGSNCACLTMCAFLVGVLAVTLYSLNTTKYFVSWVNNLK